MEGFLNAVNQSLLTRVLANIFIFLVLVSALAIACYQLIFFHTIDAPVNLVLGTGMGYAVNVLGINQGVTLQPMPVTQDQKPAVTQELDQYILGKQPMPVTQDQKPTVTQEQKN